MALPYPLKTQSSSCHQQFIDHLQLATRGEPLIILGMMSGTSVDGIDTAICRVRADERIGRSNRLVCETLFLDTSLFEDELRREIFEVFRNGPGSLELATGLGLKIGRAYGLAARQALERANSSGLNFSMPAAVAVHGQTIWHSPPPHFSPGSFQCIDPSAVASLTGLAVVSDFRRADMAVGGQGAPLVPFFDWNQYSSNSETRVLLNLGGIANATVLPAGGNLDAVLGWDTGPGNVLIDLISENRLNQPMDRDGSEAAKGRVIQPLLDEWMSHEYFSRKPPKSTGRELFGMAQWERCDHRIDGNDTADLLATATEWTALSVAMSLAEVLGPGQLQKVLVAGGGAFNGYLMKRLSRQLEFHGFAGVRVEPVGSALDIRAREAAAFAMMGYATLGGRPSNVPHVTGATQFRVLGVLSPPQSVSE
jgi:anhydro-N-acetylmuramic acid kinase